MLFERVIICSLLATVITPCLYLAPSVIERAAQLGWTPVVEFGLLPLIVTISFGTLSLGATIWEHA